MNAFNLNPKTKMWKRNKPGYHIDMTPYVDVIMLLLTFFIMTTILEKPQVMQINLPKGDDPVKVPMNNITYIRVAENGAILISKGKENGTEEAPSAVLLKDMNSVLETLYAQNNDMMMILKFHRKAKYDTMVNVLDVINNSNIEKRYSFVKMDDNDLKLIENMGG